MEKSSVYKYMYLSKTSSDARLRTDEGIKSTCLFASIHVILN